jgi:hypothetical protein
MKQLLTRRRAAVLAAGIALLAAGGATASAQAATASVPQHVAVAQSATAPSSPDVDFTCPSATVCLFPNDNYTGNYPGWGGPAELATDVWNGEWYSFADAAASDPNPGSLNDNSNSVMWIYAKDAGVLVCLTPGKYVPDHAYGYFYIQYGVTSCGTAPEPLP